MTEIKRPVFFSGENPGMTLYRPGTEQATAVASYWHCTDSLQGVGHTLVLWLDGAPSGIFSDNLLLAQSLVQNLTQHFPEFKEIPVTGLSYILAECGHTFDGTTYRATCRSSDTLFELEWVELLDRKQVIWPRFPAGEAAYDLTTIICPCRVARVWVNGQPIPGETQIASTNDGHLASSAFLAFAESWVGPV
jgi:hypothetical protein